jgi:O-antigen ligase
VELSLAHPIGIGPGQFEFYSPVETHSTYVRVLSEQGLIGLTLIVVLLGATLLMALSNAHRRAGTYGIGSASLLGVWCGILLNSFVIDTLHWRHLWVVAPMIWMGWATEQMSRRSRPNSP